jgi:uncharacterized protein YigA (DUF484 family)
VAHFRQDPEFFKKHEQRLKQMRLIERGAFQRRNEALVQASYSIVSLEIAKKRKTLYW